MLMDSDKYRSVKLKHRANRNQVRRDSRVRLVVNETADTLPHAVDSHKVGSVLRLKGHYYAAVWITSTPLLLPLPSLLDETGKTYVAPRNVSVGRPHPYFRVAFNRDYILLEVSN